MTKLTISPEELPGLYQSANNASITAQSRYYWCLRLYLIFLIAAAVVSFYWSNDSFGAGASAVLFLMTLGILIILRVVNPDDLWYNGRAVAESVKTRAWRWMMRAEPYGDDSDPDSVSKLFINDQKEIFDQNRGLSAALDFDAVISDPVTDAMRKIRELPVSERLDVYMEQRIDDQAAWYSAKAIYNKRRSRLWFFVSVFLHSSTIVMLLYKIKDPSFNLPVGVVATAAGAVLTWQNAKKHNELNSSYTLTTQEIVLIKGEASLVKGENGLSEFVLDSENAFSREHTQWVARKS